MSIHLGKRLEKITIFQIAAIFFIWVILFALFYTIIPKHSDSMFIDSQGNQINGFMSSLYYSFSITTTLGSSDMSPTGIIRLFTILQVMGGIVIAGLAVNAIVSYPSRKAKKVLGNCLGWWVEQIKLPRNRIFYSFTLFTIEDNTLTKNGYNFDAEGKMDETTYLGKVITEHFPTLISLYENDQLSNDYTEGIYKFEFQKTSTGDYISYSGSCYDKKHGKRDQVIAKRISDKEMIHKADNRILTTEDKKNIIEKLFPKNKESKKNDVKKSNGKPIA